MRMKFRLVDIFFKKKMEEKLRYDKTKFNGSFNISKNSIILRLISRKRCPYYKKLTRIKKYAKYRPMF